MASRNAREQCDQGKGVGPTGRAVYLDFRDAIERDGVETIRKNTATCSRCTRESRPKDPLPDAHDHLPGHPLHHGGLMGGLQPDDHIPGLFAIGEANFSDHGANRLGASALMQGLADGYFILPYTIGGYLATESLPAVGADHDAFTEAETGAKAKINKLLSMKGHRTVDDFHRELGRVMWDYVGISRTWEGLEKAKELIPKIRAEFWENVHLTGESGEFNQALERALRVADFLELGELMAIDALNREESCGCHFNEACQTEDNEAKRNDEECAYAAAWEYKGTDNPPELHKENLTFENVQLATRSYK